MTNRCIILLLVLFFSSCNKKDKGENFSIENFQKQILLTSEKYGSTSAFYQDYEFITEQKEKRVPLFRVIKDKSENYSLYMGIPVNQKLITFTQSKLSSDLIESKTDSTNYVYQSFMSDKAFLTEFTVKINENNYYFLSETESAKIQDSIFSLPSFFNRINNAAKLPINYESN